jgi:hypothetical protein
MTDRCKNINENLQETIYLAFNTSVIDRFDEIINNDWLIYILETSQLVLTYGFCFINTLYHRWFRKEGVCGFEVILTQSLRWGLLGTAVTWLFLLLQNSKFQY